MTARGADVVDRLLTAFPGAEVIPDPALEAKRRLRDAMAARPVLLGRRGRGEIWARGPLTIVLPAVPRWTPAGGDVAVRWARAAWLDGRCPRCRARPHAHRGVVRVQHRSGCPAGRIDTRITLTDDLPEGAPNEPVHR